MLTKILPLFAALAFAAFPAPASAAPDPRCPIQGEVPHGPDWLCYGRLTDDYAFVLIFPSAARRTPALDGALRAETQRAEAWIASQRREGARARYQAVWRIDAVTPELTAMSGAISYDTGGARDGLEYQVILLDRRGRRLELEDVFEPGFFEPDMFGYRLWGVRAVQAAFCHALTVEVRARRRDPEALVECPRIEDQPVTFVCGANGRIDRMRALLNPYVMGSRAEGPYEVDVPVDAAVMSAIKRRLRPAFGLMLEDRRRLGAHSCGS